MLDLPSKPANESFLLHTPTSGRRLIGINVERAPEDIEGNLKLVFSEIEGDVANLVFSKDMIVGKNEKVVIHGAELEKRYEGGDDYIEDYVVTWTEQRKVHLPSMAIIGKPFFWDPWASRTFTPRVDFIIKKGDLTVSMENAGGMKNFRSNSYVRPVWGKVPNTLPDSVNEIHSNNNYLVFYNFWQYAKDRHVFRILKWSELEEGNFTGMGAPVELPKEASTSRELLQDYLLNIQDQLCAIWSESCLVLGGKFTKLEKIENGDWTTILELKSRKARYVVTGFFGGYYDPNTIVIKLIDARAQVLRSLEVKIEQQFYGKVKLLGSSTLVFGKFYLSVVSIRKDRLILIAKKVPVFQDDLQFSFIDSPSSQKRLLVENDGKIAVISLRNHYV